MLSSGCYSFEENIVFLFLILLIYLLTEACLFMRLSAYFVLSSQCDEPSQILLAQQHRIRRSDSILSSSFVFPLSGRN